MRKGKRNNLKENKNALIIKLFTVEILMQFRQTSIQRQTDSQID